MRLYFTLAAFVAIASGCGDDPAAPAVGSFTINPEPNSISAPWQLLGPGGYAQSGAGDMTIVNMTAGTYTLTWGAVQGWTTPSPGVVTQTLVANGSLEFAGAYSPSAGPAWLVFDDSFGPADVFEPYPGSKPDALSVDYNEKHNGVASLRVVVPDPHEPSGSFAGGYIVAAIPRDLREYNALTFWAKASAVVRLEEVGFGAVEGADEFETGREFVYLSTSWVKYVVPIPSSEPLTAQESVFCFSARSWTGHAVWFDDIQFENLSTVTNPRARLQSRQLVSFVGASVMIDGTRTTFDIDGSDVIVVHTAKYFEYQSSGPAVAVSGDNLIEVVGAGSATITATLDGIAVDGAVAVDASYPPAVAAPVPTVPAIHTISLYSDTYGTWPVVSWNPHWGGSTTQNDTYTIGGNANLMYNALNFVGIDFSTQRIDVTAMTHLHLDVYAPVGTNFRVKLVAMGATGTAALQQPELTFDAVSVPAFVAGGWSSLEIPMADFGFTVPVDNIGQIVLSTSDARLVLMDNIYWHR